MNIDAARELEGQEHFTRKGVRILALADALQKDIREFGPLRNNPWDYADLMYVAPDEVDWYELAEELLNDINEGQ